MNEDLRGTIKIFKETLKEYDVLYKGLEAQIRSLRTSTHVLKTVCSGNNKENNLHLTNYQTIIYKSSIKMTKELETIMSTLNQTISPYKSLKSSLKVILKSEYPSNKIYIELLRLITEKFNNNNGLDIMSDSLFSTNVGNFVIISMSRITEEIQRKITHFDNQVCALLLNDNESINRRLTRIDNPSQFTSFTKKTSNKKDYLKGCAFVESKSTQKQDNICSFNQDSKENYSTNQNIVKQKGNNKILRASLSKENFFVNESRHKREMSAGVMPDIKRRQKDKQAIDEGKNSEHFKLDQTINITRTPNKSSRKSDLSKKFNDLARNNLLSSSNAKNEWYINSLKDQMVQYYGGQDNMIDKGMKNISRKYNHRSGSDKSSRGGIDETLMEPYFKDFADSFSPFKPAKRNSSNRNRTPNLPRTESSKRVGITKTPLLFTDKRSYNK